MIDPKITLLSLLMDGWSLGYEAIFTTNWYNAAMMTPQVTVSHIYTRIKPIGFTEDPVTAERQHSARYTLDVWSNSQAQRQEMVNEIDRVLKSRYNTLGGDLEQIELEGWSDQDEGHLQPPVYRSRLDLEVHYYG
jgi:hypothetical protein